MIVRGGGRVVMLVEVLIGDFYKGCSGCGGREYIDDVTCSSLEYL